MTPNKTTEQERRAAAAGARAQLDEIKTRYNIDGYLGTIQYLSDEFLADLTKLRIALAPSKAQKVEPELLQVLLEIQSALERHAR